MSRKFASPEADERAEYLEKLKRARNPITGQFLAGAPGRPPGTADQKLRNSIQKLLTRIFEESGERFAELASNPESYSDLVQLLHAAAKFCPKEVRIESDSSVDSLLTLLANNPNNSPISRLKANDSESQ